MKFYTQNYNRKANSGIDQVVDVTMTKKEIDSFWDKESKEYLSNLNSEDLEAIQKAYYDSFYAIEL